MSLINPLAEAYSWFLACYNIIPSSFRALVGVFAVFLFLSFVINALRK